MPLINLRKIGLTDEILFKLQENVYQAVSQLIAIPFLDGTLLESVVLTTTAALVPHKLERPIRGYFVVKSNANAVVYDQETTNALKNQFVKLLASATVTVNLWVY